MTELVSVISERPGRFFSLVLASNAFAPRGYPPRSTPDPVAERDPLAPDDKDDDIGFILSDFLGRNRSGIHFGSQSQSLPPALLPLRPLPQQINFIKVLYASLVVPKMTKMTMPTRAPLKSEKAESSWALL